MNYLLLVGGTCLLLIGAELLVRGASRLAISLGITPLVIGLTVVAFGTSAPELAVSIAASLQGTPEFAVGNVIGSNVFNILVVLGGSAMVTPLLVTQQLIRIEIPLMIVASLVVWGLAANGVIGRLEGGILFAAIVIYIVWAVIQSRKETKEINEEYARSLGVDDLEDELQKKSWWRIPVQILLIVVGLGFLTVGSDVLVQGATGIAIAWGVSSAVIGLTIIAGGTSLPEVATSLIAAFRGEKDIAIGNVIGSNLFNLLCVLGGAALVSPAGIAVDASFLRLDFPVMVIVAIICLPIVWRGSQVSRGEGTFLVACYVAYITVLVRQVLAANAV